MNYSEINRIKVFFIVGIGRSGTTLLRTILNSHPNTVIPFESRLIIYLKNKYNNCQVWNERKVEEFTEDLYTDRKFNGSWNVDRAALKNQFLSIPEEHRNFKLFCKIIYLSFPSIYKKEKIVLVGDKNPSYSFFIEEISELFPNAKFIHVIRDYRDTISSFKTHFKTNNVALLAHRWIFFNKLIESHKKNLSGNFYTIRYEDLVHEPEKFIPEICRFLEIDFLPKMLDFHKTTAKAYEDQSSETIDNLFPDLLKPIHTDNIGKWKENLSEEEADIIEYVVGANRNKYGYQKAENLNNSSYPIKSLKGFAINVFVIQVTINYYFLPFVIRKYIRLTSDYLFRKLKLVTFYNEDEINIDQNQG